MQQLKAVCKPNSRERKLLKDGSLFMEFVGSKGGDSDRVQIVTWAHIGFALLNPYRQSFERLTPSDPPAGERVPDGVVYLRTLCQYKYDYIFSTHLK